MTDRVETLFRILRSCAESVGMLAAIRAGERRWDIEFARVDRLLLDMQLTAECLRDRGDGESLLELIDIAQGLSGRLAQTLTLFREPSGGDT